MISFVTHSISGSVRASTIFWQVILYAGIAALFGVAVRLVIWPYLLPKGRSGEKRRETVIRAGDSSEWAAHIKDGAIIGTGFEFFPSRDILGKHRTLDERTMSASAVWVMWLTGTHATGVMDVIQNGNIKRLILLHPMRSPMKELAERLTGNTQAEDLIADVIRTTRKALAKRKEQDTKQDPSPDNRMEVRWYPGEVTNSIMMGNPDTLRDDSWLQVENLIPIRTERRSSYTLVYGHTPFRSLFEDVRNDFNRLWDKSVPVTEGMLESVEHRKPMLVDSTLERMVIRDRANLARLILVLNQKLVQHRLDPVMGGEFQFAFDVFNGSVLSVKVGSSVQGHLLILDRKCHDMAEPLQSLTIDHGSSSTIMIKQRILPEVVKQIGDGASKPEGIRLRFAFNDISISVQEEQSQATSLALSLTGIADMEFRVKRDNSSYADFCTWTWEPIIWAPIS